VGRVRAVAFDLFPTLVDPEDFRSRGFRRARAFADLLGIPAPEFEADWEAGMLERVLAMEPSATDRVRQYCSAHRISPPGSSWPTVTHLFGRYQDLAIRSPRVSVLKALHPSRTRGWSWVS
jgi:hypothetical protein